MPRYLALEWDGFELRAAVALAQRGDVLVEHAFSVPLAARDPGETFESPDIGRRIAEELAARKVTKVETLVAVGRASIELKLLSLPPSPDDELPELVRFQAMREFNNLGEDWPLDFVTIGSDPEQPRSLLAAAISPRLVKQIQQTCDAASLSPTRLILRPCAAASLLRRRATQGGCRVRLLVDQLADEADLTVLVDDTVVFMRTARLPANAESEQLNGALIREIRRTMAAVHNQLEGDRIELIDLCGSGEEQQTLASLLADQLDLPVECFDPFDQLRLTGELSRKHPQNPGRFAPLLGMLLDEAAEAAHAIDFLNPTRKSEPPSRRRSYTWAGAAAGVIALALVAIFWWQLSARDNEIADLRKQIAKNKKLIDGYQEKDKKVKGQTIKGKKVHSFRDLEKKIKAIDAWAGADITWLNELAQLSQNFPPAGDAMVTQLQIDSGRESKARLESVARTSLIVDSIYQKLSDSRRTAVSHGRLANPNSQLYPIKFAVTVTLAPEDASGGAPKVPAPSTTKTTPRKPGQ